MKFSINAVLGLSLLVSSVGEAKGLFDSKLARLAASVGKTKKMAPLKADNCSNFSGNWVGQCVNRNDSTDTETKKLSLVQNKCTDIIFDGIQVPTHGSTSITTFFPTENQDGLNSTGALSGAWNDAQTRFTVVLNFSFRGGISAHLIDSTNYQLDGEELTSSDGAYGTIIDEFGAPTSWERNKYDCRYSRQP
jgi:hypothetical protein